MTSFAGLANGPPGMPEEETSSPCGAENGKDTGPALGARGAPAAAAPAAAADAAPAADDGKAPLPPPGEYGGRHCKAGFDAEKGDVEEKGERTVDETPEEADSGAGGKGRKLSGGGGGICWSGSGCPLASRSSRSTSALSILSSSMRASSALAAFSACFACFSIEAFFS